MALAYADRVQETTTTTGTGTLTLAGAVTGFQAFSAAFSTGVTVQFCTTDGTNWEVAEGVYTTSGTTLTRATIIASSNSGSAVSWSSGSKNVFNVTPAFLFSPITTFNSTTTWTAPASGVLLVTGCGGGGGGGGGSTFNPNTGGGGGGGAIQGTVLVSVVAGTSYTVTIGAGGAGGADAAIGGYGGTSTFGSLASFVGASGGAYYPGSTVGSPGGACFNNNGTNVYTNNNPGTLHSGIPVITALYFQTPACGGECPGGATNGFAGNYNLTGGYAPGAGGTSTNGNGGGGGGGAGPAGVGVAGANDSAGTPSTPSAAGANTGAGGGGAGGGATGGAGGNGGSGFITIHYV